MREETAYCLGMPASFLKLFGVFEVLAGTIVSGGAIYFLGENHPSFVACILAGVLLMGAGVSSITLGFLIQPQKAPTLLPPLKPLSTSPSGSEETSVEWVLSTPNVIHKFLSHTMAFWFLGGIVVFLGGFLAYGVMPGSGHPAWQRMGMAVFLGGGVWVGVRGSRNIRKEKELYLKTVGRELVLSKEGLACSTGLLEGDTRIELRQSEEPYLYAHWSAIREFIVEPVRGHKTTFPACYKIKIATGEKYIYIRRRPFFGQEQKIIDALRTHLPCPVTLNDSLR